MASDADDRKQQQPTPPQGQHRFPSDPEQQQELQELRRQFAEVGKRISAFEPASADEHRERPLVLAGRIALPAKQLALPRWRLVAAVALIFVFGAGVGYALPRVGSNHAAPPPAPSTARPPLSVSVQPQQPQPQPVASVPQACLETARRGDELVYLFTVNDRSRRLVQALKAYTLASQACRQQASP
jgi:hypothetical protein